MNEVNTNKPGIIIHGGAWDIPDALVLPTLEAVRKAASTAYRMLEQGCSALDAVEAAVCILEDDPCMNAGCGSALTEEGTIEMDAMIMEGTNLNSGAVACVKNVKNPVSFARKVMEKTPHTLIVGSGAQQLVKDLAVETMQDDYFVDARSKFELNLFRSNFNKAVDVSFNNRNHDTVGAVAIDTKGCLACATSTGGITSKKAGRVGDSPIIGSGGYADNCIGAVSCTGHGESISKICLAKDIMFNMQTGLPPQIANEKSLEKMLGRVGWRGGCVSISCDGRMAASFTTSRMAWAAVQKGTLQSGINRTDQLR